MHTIDLSPLLTVIAVLVLFGLAGSIFKALVTKGIEFPYAKRKSLFSPAELQFLRALELAVDDSVRVFGKVRIEDLLMVTGVSGKRRLAARGRIKSRHVDFVLCDASTGTILCAIELDDRSHQSAKAKRTDRFKDGCFAVAGLPLIRFNPRSAYSVEDLKEKLVGFSISSSPAPALDEQACRAPDALTGDAEFSLISQLSGDSGAFVLTQAPSSQLKATLKRHGYRARKIDGSWIWSRPEAVRS